MGLAIPVLPRIALNQFGKSLIIFRFLFQLLGLEISFSSLAKKQTNTNQTTHT